MDAQKDIIDQILAHAADENFDICDYPGIPQIAISEDEQKANIAAIAKLGNDFSKLHKDVMPLCGKLSFPMPDTELEWVISNISVNGWQILDKYFVLNDNMQALVEKHKTSKRGKYLYDALKAINDEARNAER